MTEESKTARLTVLADPVKEKTFEALRAAQDLTPAQVVELAPQRARRRPGGAPLHAAPPPSALPVSRFEQLLRASKGKPFVFDDGGMRSLHFDGRCMQSAMWLTAPDELMFAYTRAMMGCLLFNPAPAHILMVGLGGGSLAKYCHRYLPTTRITVLEVDPDVIALRGKFMIPPDGARFQVVQADAAVYIAQAEANVDVLMLDGYNADGIVPELCSPDFYAACRRILTPSGMLAANLWSDTPDDSVCMERLRAEFDGRLWWCPAADSCNQLVFAVNDRRRVLAPHALAQRGLALDRCFKLELRQLAARLQTVGAGDA